MTWHVIVKDGDNKPKAQVVHPNTQLPTSPDILDCIECSSRQEAFDVVLTHSTYHHLHISLPMTLTKTLSLVRDPKYPGHAAIERMYYQGARFDSNGYADRPE